MNLVNSKPKTSVMYGCVSGEEVENFGWLSANKTTARFLNPKKEIIQVLVREDINGDLFGWWDNISGSFTYVGKSRVVLQACFSNSIVSLEKAGIGEVVQVGLTIKNIGNILFSINNEGKL